jgi:Ig-like domain from next to BRCA1 gene
MCKLILQRQIRFLSALVLLAMLTVACIPKALTPAPPGYASTLAAKTWQVMEKAFTATPTQPTATNTLLPLPASFTPTQTLTSLPSLTPVPSFTPIPSRTPVTPSATPTVTLTPTRTPYQGGGGGGGGGGSGGGGGGGGGGSTAPCDAARLDHHITVPDGSILPPGSRFLKVWRIQNVGSCTWDKKYKFAIVEGDPMGAPLEISIGQTVLPEESVDIALEMVAPNVAGVAFGKWMLKHNEYFFGDEGTKKKFNAAIVVDPGSGGVVFDLHRSFCTALWRNSADTILICPSKTQNRIGFVMSISSSTEGASGEKKNLLLTFPQTIKDGTISGEYPYVPIPANARFRAEVGCLVNMLNCNVAFQVYTQVYGGPTVSRGVWFESYDSTTTQIDINLGDVAGQLVSIILQVRALNNPDQAAAFWFQPRIVAP